MQLVTVRKKPESFRFPITHDLVSLTRGKTEQWIPESFQISHWVKWD